MEENKLIPSQSTDITFDEELSGVRIERSKRRSKRKRRGKKFLLLVFAVCLTFIIIKNFSYIKGFVSSLFEEPSPDTSAVNSDVQSENTDSISQASNSVLKKYDFIDTSPNESIFINESNVDIDPDSMSFVFPALDELYSTYSDSAPVVLIVNFSSYECYSEGGGYSEDSQFYSPEFNVEAIGEQICALLNVNGINALHLKNTSIEGTLYESKEKYARSIEAVLESNPSITYIFDISRSLDINGNMSMDKEAVEIDGVKYPTVQFICGTNDTEITDTQAKGIYLASKLSQSINSSAPILISRQIISKYDLGQCFSVPCIRVDIGSYACTYEEAALSADLFAGFLINYLNN